MASPQIVVRLDARLRDRIDREATRRGITASQLVRDLLAKRFGKDLGTVNPVGWEPGRPRGKAE